MTRKSMLALIGTAVFGTLAVAQQPPPLLNISRIQVKADRMAEFLEIQKKITDAYKKGGANFRLVARSVTGNPLEVMTIAGMNNYAERDAESSAVRKAMTDAEWTALLARRAQCTVSVRTTIEQSLPEYSIIPASSTLPKFIRETRTRVRPGKSEEFLAMMKGDVLPAIRKLNVTSYRLRRVQWGGSRAEFAAASPMEKWAELDVPADRLRQAMGADGYKRYLDKVSAVVAFSEYNVWTLVPDASYRNQ